MLAEKCHCNGLACGATARYLSLLNVSSLFTLSAPADHLSSLMLCCAKVLLSSPRRDLFAMACR